MELQGPIMTQPGAGAVPLGCPPGLEYLTQVDHLIVKGKVELLEAFTGDLMSGEPFLFFCFTSFSQESEKAPSRAFSMFESA